MYFLIDTFYYYIIDRPEEFKADDNGHPDLLRLFCVDDRQVTSVVDVVRLRRQDKYLFKAMNTKAASHHCAHEWQPNESPCCTETN